MPAKRGYKIDLSLSSGIAFPDAAKPKFSGVERAELRERGRGVLVPS
jgi:hypothetical protein